MLQIELLKHHKIDVNWNTRLYCLHGSVLVFRNSRFPNKLVTVKLKPFLCDSLQFLSLCDTETRHTLREHVRKEERNQVGNGGKAYPAHKQETDLSTF